MSGRSRKTVEDIEREARDLRNRVLRNVKAYEPNAKNARSYLDGRYAAEFLRFKFEKHPELDMSLGLVGHANRWRRTGIAGMIDRPDRLIVVSEKFSEEEQRFTGLHEVGHAVLHPELRGAHRDRPIGSSKPRAELGPLEWEADQFAVAYSMPEAWFVKDVEDRFMKVPIEVDEGLLWRLDPGDPDRFFRTRRDDLDLEKAIVSYAGFGQSIQFPSLKAIYGMSLTATALRVKELKLVDRSRVRWLV